MLVQIESARWASLSWQRHAKPLGYSDCIGHRILLNALESLHRSPHGSRRPPLQELARRRT